MLGKAKREIFSGTLEVYHTVFYSDSNPVPRELFQKKMRHFLRTLPIHVVSLSELGFRRTPLVDRRMLQLFGDRPFLYHLYVWPLLHMPQWAKTLALTLYRSRLTRWIPRGTRKVLSWLGGR